MADNVTHDDPLAALALANEHPNGRLDLRIPALNAGASARRTIRALLLDAELSGATIHSREQRGLLQSTFTIHATGAGNQLKPLLAGLTHLTEATRTRRMPGMSSPHSWRINPETLNLDREDGTIVTTFNAQDWRAQEWPPCPVCGTTIDVAQVNVQTRRDPFPVYMMGAWECPNHCDPRPALREARDD